MNTHSAGVGFSRDRDALWHEIGRMARAVTGAIRTFYVWMERRRQRKTLAGLDDHMLRDIGLDRHQVLQETSKPFWQA